MSQDLRTKDPQDVPADVAPAAADTTAGEPAPAPARPVPPATHDGPTATPQGAVPQGAVPPPPRPPVAPSPQPVPYGAPGAPRRRPRGAVAAAAALGVLVGGAGTFGVVRALDDSPPAPPAPAAGDVRPAPDRPAPDQEPVHVGDGWEAVAARVRPSVVAIEVVGRLGSGEGSGVIIDADGRIVTNDHVVGGAEHIQVTLMDGRVLDAELVGTDPTTDVAVVAIVDPPDDLQPAEFGDSAEVAVGEPVMAVGNPLGLDSTVTTGIVSAVDRPVTTGTEGGREPVVTNAIQVDAAINPGNSGGPVFDAAGRVVGIASSILTTSRSSGSIGLGFAIPSNLARRIADELIENGAVEHAYLGVTLDDGRATADGETRVGAVVTDVLDDTPAAAAGLRRGDVIVEMDGAAVRSAESMIAQVRERAPGDVSTLTVVRDEAELEIDVTLTSREEPTVKQGVWPLP